MDSVIYTEEFLRSIDIHTLLPQQEPFVMVSRLISYSSDAAATETDVVASNILVEDGRFTPAGLLENIAQTCAARTGFYYIYILKIDVTVGVIGAVRNYTIHELPPVGAVIQTRMKIIQEVFGMTLAEAEVVCGDKVYATAEIKLSVRE